MGCNTHTTRKWSYPFVAHFVQRTIRERPCYILAFQIAVMVLSGSPEGSSFRARPLHLHFTGNEEEDVKKFFFIFENVGANDEEATGKSSMLLEFIDGQDLLFLDTFVVERVMSEEGAVYHNVKQVFLNKFSHRESSEEIITSALEARIDRNDLENPMREMNSGYEKTRIDEIAWDELLRRAVEEYPDMAQFALYRWAPSYRELKQVLEDFCEGAKHIENVTKVLPGVGKHKCQTPVANNTENSI